MSLEKVNLEQTNLFSSIIIDYVNNNENLKEFYQDFPSIENFKKNIDSKQFSVENRNVLVNELKLQYQNLDLSFEVENNINELNSTKTYTITTGHQLNIFTGPLYFIYKIAGVIKLCNQLKIKFPEHHFVPVYWMATEDHDFEEINHFRLFKEIHTWNSNQKGAVGRFSTNGIESIFESIKEELPLFKEAYTTNKNLADATRFIVNTLFSKYGLICLDADRKAFKNEFKDVILKEILEQPTFLTLSNSIEKLQNNGYKHQISPREINLFYLDNHLRERIVEENGYYKVLNTELSFSKQEIITLVNEFPEKFSPNVALRPVYQEVILPNLAYIGGPGEIHYWLQLKATFEAFNVPFPILFLRDFILVITKTIHKKIEKLGLKYHDVFKDYDSLKKEIIQQNSDAEQLVNRVENKISDAFEELIQAIPDASTQQSIEAEKQKVIKNIKKIDSKVHKYFEIQNETVLNQLVSIKDFTFPNGVPQERIDNFLNFQINDNQFVDSIIQASDVFDMRYKIIY